MMLFVFIAIVLLAVIAVGFLAGSMMWLVKSRYKNRQADEPVLDSRLTDTSKVGTCAGCGKRRILVRHDDSLCAFCYSSFRTKKA